MANKTLEHYHILPTVQSFQAESTVSSDEIRKVLTDLNNSINVWNDYAAKTKCPVQLKVSQELIGRLKSDTKDDRAVLNNRYAAAVADMKNGSKQGVLHPHQIRTIIDTIAQYLNQDKDMVLIGAPQLGKTMVFVPLFFMLPIVEQLNSGKSAAAFINLPSSKNIFSQAIQEADGFAKFYGNCKVILRGKNNYEINKFSSDYLSSLSDQDRPFYQQYIAQRNRSQLAKWCNYLIRHKNRPTEVIIGLIDECHYGSGSSMCQEKWETNNGSNGQEKHDLNKLFRLRRVMVSATPSEMLCPELQPHFVRIPMWVPNSYCGPVHYSGVSLRITPNAKPTMPEVCYHVEYLKARGIDAKLDYCEFKHATEGKFPPRVAEQIKREFARNITDAFVKLTTDRHSVFFLRSSRRGINISRELILLVSEELTRRRLSAKFKIMPYFDKLSEQFNDPDKASKQKKTLKKVLQEHYIDKNLRVMVVSDSRSMMGDSYPRECKYFLDVTFEPTTWNTFVQGTYGRACGHGKESVCLVSKNYARILNQFIETNCSDLTSEKRLCSRTNYEKTKTTDNNYGRPRAANYQLTFAGPNGIDLDPNAHPLVKTIFADIKKLINDTSSGIKHTAGGKGRPANKIFRDEVLSNQRIDALSRIAMVPLAHWGDRDDVGEQSDKFISSGEDKIGFRCIVNLPAWQTWRKKGNNQKKNNRMDSPSDDKICPQLVYTPKPNVKCKGCRCDTRLVFLAAKLTFNSKEQLDPELEKIYALRTMLFPQLPDGQYLREKQLREIKPCCVKFMEMVPLAVMIRRCTRPHVQFKEKVAPAQRQLVLMSNSRHHHRS